MAAQTETYEPKLSHSFFNLPCSQDLAVIGRLGWLVGTRGPAAKKQPSTAPRPTEKPERARTPVNGFVSSEHATFAGVFTLNGWFGPFNRRACSLSFFPHRSGHWTKNSRYTSILCVREHSMHDRARSVGSEHVERKGARILLRQARWGLR